MTYTVITEPTGWSYIVGPDGYREGPIRYRWEADEWAEEMNAKVRPADTIKHLRAMLRQHRCKSDGAMTVAECIDSGRCGCSDKD